MVDSTDGESEQTETPVRKKSVAVKVWRVIAVILLAGILFFGGVMTGYCSVSSSARSLNWLRKTVMEQYYQEITEDEFYDALINGTLFDSSGNGLLDAYSEYYSPSEYSSVSQEKAGNYSGTGISYMYEGSATKLYRVAGNSPAEKGGLVAGMYLTGYGETDSEEDRVDGGYSKAYLNFLYEQDEGEVFYLWASEEKGEVGQAYAVYRANYKQNYVFYADNEAAYRFVGDSANTPEEYVTRYSYLPSNVAIVRLDAFSGSAAEQFKLALGILKERGRTKLLLDLRNNGGGQMSILAEIAAYLCKDAPSGSFPVAKAIYRSGKTEEFTASKNRYSEYLDGVSVSLLANKNTASASEALMGALVDYGTVEMKDIYLAEIDGTAKSYGKGIMQTTFLNVITGEGVKLTTATVHWPVSGTSIHGTGVTPSMGATSVASEGAMDIKDKMLRTMLENYF